jgi:hypothetical protein
VPEMRVSLGAAWRQAFESLSELLDAILEGTMKRLFIVLIAALLFVQCAYAFEIPILGIKIFEPADSAEPIINEAAPVIVEPTLEIQKGFENESIVDTVSRTIGFSKEKRNITITRNGQLLAVIPEDSPFANIAIHDSCLTPVQPYGTIDWYNCEVAKQ